MFIKHGVWCLARQRPQSLEVAVSAARPTGSWRLAFRLFPAGAQGPRVSISLRGCRGCGGGGGEPCCVLGSWLGRLDTRPPPIPPGGPEGLGGGRAVAERSLCPQTSLMANCRAPRRPWLASHMSTVFVSLLCFPSFLGAAVFLCYAIWQ